MRELVLTDTSCFNMPSVTFLIHALRDGFQKLNAVCQIMSAFPNTFKSCYFDDMELHTVFFFS